MYYNPWTVPQTYFEQWHLASVKDYGRNEHTEELFILGQPEETKLTSFYEKRNILLYSGGKESFLTANILDFYGIKYEKLFIDETGDIRDSEKHECYNDVARQIKDSCDHVIESNVIEKYITSNRFGRNFPITYYYILDTMERFECANVLVGAEWLSGRFLHNQIKYEHSDILYHDLNSDPEVDGSVYSIVNCLLEFDIYRIVSNYLGYDDRWSYYDHKKKEERIGYFKRMNNLICDIDKSTLRDDVLSELEFIVPQVRIMSPIFYDFRCGISNFIERLNG